MNHELEHLLFTLPVLDANVAARFFGHDSRYRIDKWRQRKQGPSYYEIGGGPKPRVRYALRDLITYALQESA